MLITNTTTMETLTEQDLDWLTQTQGRLVRMRKRESANTNKQVDTITDVIRHIHRLRQSLQSRFGLPTDADISAPRSFGSQSNPFADLERTIFAKQPQ